MEPASFNPEFSINSKPPPTESDKRRQQSCPAQMGWPSVRVNEELNDERHGEQRQRRNAGEEAQNQQRWKYVLRRRRDVGGHLGRNKRQLVFVAKELEGAVGQRKPPFHFRAPREEEDRGDRESLHQKDHGKREQRLAEPGDERQRRPAARLRGIV